MFLNRTADGRNNYCGKAVARRRRELGWSQRELADRLQRLGLDVDKNAVQRMESGKRFVTDIELCYLSRALGLSLEELTEEEARAIPQER